MPWRNQNVYPMTPASLQSKAPLKEGVYGIRSGDRWLYVGQSEDLRRRLIELFQDRSNPIHKYPNLEFLCEVTPMGEDRMRQLLIEFRPLCNSPYD
jgi:excinuclease UvrABC nuclease subunit